MVDTLNKFGVPVNGTRAGMLMPKRTHTFRVLFSNFGPLNSHQSVDLTRQVVSVSRPSLVQGPVTLHSYNSVAHYAGKHSWENLGLVARDDVTNLVSRLVGYQVQKQLNHFEQTSPIAGSNYKFNIILEQMDGGNEGVLERWDIEGAWLEGTDYSDNDYSSAEAMTIKMNIKYDNATLSGGLFPDMPELLGGVRV